MNDHPIHFEGKFRQVGSAEFDNHQAFGDLHYSDASASAYLSHTLSENNSLSWQLGYTYMHLGWDKNPRFDKQNFYNAVTSLAWISNAIDRWRWVVLGGGTIDGETFNFGSSAVGFGMMWGRYAYTQRTGLHVGMVGYGGIRNVYMLPVLGFDFRTEHWTFNAVFPLDFSIRYDFAQHWETVLNYTTFGGPYKYPYRGSGGSGDFHNPIVNVYSQGVDLSLNLKCTRFRTGVGAGWNSGGWILVKDHANHHGKYYKFHPAPYGQINLEATF